jgi:ketosteroid isomerase-like protein
VPEYTEAIAKGYAAFNRRDADSILASLDEDIEYRLPLDPTRRFPAFRGHDGVREFYETLWESFDEFRAEVVSVNRAGDVIIVVGQFHIRRNPGDDEFTAAFAHFWKVADGRVVQVGFHDAINPLALLDDAGEGRRPGRDRRHRGRGHHDPSVSRSQSVAS